jgi:hypothetical protein
VEEKRAQSVVLPCVKIDTLGNFSYFKLPQIPSGWFDRPGQVTENPVFSRNGDGVDSQGGTLLIVCETGRLFDLMWVSEIIERTREVRV